MHWPDDRDAIGERYNTDGFVVVRQFCRDSEVQVFRNDLNRYISDIVPGLPAMDVFFEDKAARRQIRQLPRMHEHDDRFREQLTTGPSRELVSPGEHAARRARTPALRSTRSPPHRLHSIEPTHTNGQRTGARRLSGIAQTTPVTPPRHPVRRNSCSPVWT